MAIYDNNGTANAEIGTLYDHNGTAAAQIGTVYDNDGTTSRLLYQSEYLIFNGTAAAEYTGGWTVRVSAGSGYTSGTSGSALKLTQTDYKVTTGVIMNSVNKITFTGYTQLHFTYSNTFAGNGRFKVGVSSDKTNYDVSNTNDSLLVYNQKTASFSGTVDLNVSSITSGYIQFSVFGSSANNAINVTKIWLT